MSAPYGDHLSARALEIAGQLEQTSDHRTRQRTPGSLCALARPQAE